MQFSGSRALSEALEILKGRFGPLVAVTLIFYVALFGVVLALGGGMAATMMAAGGADPAQAFAGMGLSIVLLYLVIYAIQFAQAIATMRLCSDRHPPSIGEAMSAGLRGVPTMFGVVLLLMLAGIVVGLVLSLVAAGLMAAANSAALSLVLALLLFGAMLYLLARLSLIVPVIAIDEVMNPVTVIANSWRMTASSAFKIVLVYGLALIVMAVIMIALFFATIGLPGLAATTPSPGGIIGLGVAILVLGLTLGLYFNCLIAAIHRQLSSGNVAATSQTFD